MFLLGLILRGKLFSTEVIHILVQILHSDILRFILAIMYALKVLYFKNEDELK